MRCGAFYLMHVTPHAQDSAAQDMDQAYLSFDENLSCAHAAMEVGN